MKKIIKKWGDSYVVSFSPEEIKIYGLKLNDVIDIKIVKIKTRRRK